MIRSYLAMMLTAILSSSQFSCIPTKPKDSKISASPQNLKDIEARLEKRRDSLIASINFAYSEFLEESKTTGKNEFLFFPSLINCRLGSKFKITIAQNAQGAIKTVNAFFAIGALTRHLSFDLRAGGPKPIAVYYKLSDVSDDHELPIMKSNGTIPEDPEVEISRILKDFGQYFRGSDPEEYLLVNETTNAKSAYLNYLFALGDLNDYLVDLIQYRKLEKALAH